MYCSKTLFSLLKQYWGYDSFRPLQEDIINSVLEGKDTLALMPTGGGKSLCFQVPALMQEGMCLVVTPLIALMKDQVQALNDRGIRAIAIYSGLDRRDIQQRLDNALFGDYKFLYVSPERLMTNDFQRRLPDFHFNLIAIDEAHCISQWGYDFRPSYLQIADIRPYCPDVPLLALTATATPDVVQDIQKQLHFRAENVFCKSFERKNLHYAALLREDKYSALLQHLQQHPGSAVVYVRNRKKTKEVADFLRLQGITAEHFHAGLTNEEKDQRQQRWMRDETRVIVATNAFGMGIDKADVRSVIHLGLPDTLEAYYQEAGRAGRDGLDAWPLLLYDGTDVATTRRRVSQSFPAREFIFDVYNKLFNYYQIGLGSGLDHTFAFHLEEFCSLFHLPMLSTHGALKLLQQGGYLELSEEVNMPARVQVIQQRDELYLTQRSPEQEGVLRTILRLYSGLFADPVGIDEQRIGRNAKAAIGRELTVQQVQEALIQLSRCHVLKYIPHQITPYLTITLERQRTEDLHLSKEIYEDRRDHYKQKLEAIIEYATQHRFCRSQLLLSYFGETDARPCGSCDICQS